MFKIKPIIGVLRYKPLRWNSETFESIEVDQGLAKRLDEIVPPLSIETSRRQRLNEEIRDILTGEAELLGSAGELCYKAPIDPSFVVKPPLALLVDMDTLKTMFPHANENHLENYLPEFNTQLQEAGINTPKQLAYFFATVNVETAGMTKMVENDFHYRDPTVAKKLFSKLRNMSDSEVRALGHGELFANTIYAHRNGNGDAKSGDGYSYRGRGLFHHTGRESYNRLGGEEFLKNPDLVLDPHNDVKAAVSYWKRKGLTKASEALDLNIIIPKDKDPKKFNIHFQKAVIAINGGTTGITDRALAYNRYTQFF